jgi:hypothetical protein
MRNILVFPDGTEQHFMYPPNRDIQVGEKLVVHMMDDSHRIFTVVEIYQKDKSIYYRLSY